MIRSLMSARRTLPSRTDRTRNFSAMARMSSVEPLNPNEDVRDATRNDRTALNALRISSVMPSQKYPFSGSGLRFVNGNTAIEFSGGCGGGSGGGVWTRRAAGYGVMTVPALLSAEMNSAAPANRSAGAFASARVGAIGPKTAAALERRGIVADRVAKAYVGEGLASELIEGGERGRVLLARALVARDALPEALRQAGFTVDVVPVYETRPVAERGKAALRELFAARKADAILFTSSSTVTETLDALGPDAKTLLEAVTVASIGPITTATLAAASVRVDLTADVYTVDGLLDALQRHYLERA